MVVDFDGRDAEGLRQCEAVASLPVLARDPRLVDRLSMFNRDCQPHQPAVPLPDPVAVRKAAFFQLDVVEDDVQVGLADAVEVPEPRQIRRLVD
jgi:hypothetical protein